MAAVLPSATRRIESCIFARTTGSRVLSVPCSSTSPGITFGAVPPWIMPKVSTPTSLMDSSLETIVCIWVTTNAAATIGSTQR